VVPPISAVGLEVRTLGAEVRMSVAEASMERAFRILQAIANECATRGWTLERETTDDQRFRISTDVSPEALKLRRLNGRKPSEMASSSEDFPLPEAPAFSAPPALNGMEWYPFPPLAASRRL
jgi:hypothetical protein